MNLRRIFLLVTMFMLLVPNYLTNVNLHAAETVDTSTNTNDKNYPADRTPTMGWSSWNAFHIDINEDLIKEMADIMESSGLKDAGYEYVNVDDGYFGGRDENDVLYANEKFPSGMKSLADYIHSKGLKAGIYTDAGITRCAPIYDNDPYFPEGGGSYGYRQLDFNTFINDWGYDFVKVDWCGAELMDLDPQTEYTSIKENIEATGKDVVYEVCNWTFPGEWVTDVASHWRISGDIRPNFGSITHIIDLNAGLAEYAGPGHYNHMDMLQVGNGMSYEEDKSHFSMWSIMASPLLLGNDLREMSEETLSILTNEEVIAVNQDPLGIQGERIVKNGEKEVWLKPIENYTSGAVALFNRSNTEAEITVNWDDIGLEGNVSVRDIWEHEDKGEFSDSYTATVPAHGIVMLKVKGDAPFEEKISYSRSEVADVTIDLKSDGNEFVSILNGDQQLVEGEDYLVEDNQVILKGEYVISLPDGKNDLTIKFSNNWNQKLEIDIYGEPYTYYLSDLPWESATSGWGQVTLDKGFGDYDLSLNGIVYEKGIWVNSNSEIVYDLQDKYQTFKAIVGNDDYKGEDPGNGTITFEVWTDGVKQFDSGLMEGEDTNTKDVVVDVEGVNELKLVVTDGGDNNWWDRAIWADAKLIAEPKIDLSSLETLLEEAATISNDDGTYTEDTYNALQTAIADAREALETIETEADLTDAKAALQRAIDNLEEVTEPDPVLDTTELEKLLEKANAVSNEDGTYTKGSYEALQTAIVKANSDLDQIETEEELVASLNSLQAAMNGLKKADDDLTENDSEDNASENEEHQDNDATDDTNGELPNTATSMYNWIIAGILLLIVGLGTTLFVRRRYN
ncbi:Alpha-galactosidase A precursor [Paraliobacillus sp. PM-2]|uniref:NPCBM/NEW2 domain-containing protein n=1 Tax=Paraliobacillus sp. PM-2 TaxID=1462524 RepID=UPI00061BB85D|nr:NPCBM/NEW2 domain-containing protein [Paraliobacillus sp. PM-2]CQR47316.1 Alpha-galactosidase A precursor [Paraliobacillus sp. PM-2]